MRALAPLLLLTGCAGWLGGASSKDATQLLNELGPEAGALIMAANAGVDRRLLMDHHTHVVGLGVGDTGAFVNEQMQQGGFTHRLKFDVYASAARITDFSRADQQYVERLVELIRHAPGHGRHLILAFDKHYLPDGTPDLAHTEFYVPNDYVFALAKKHPQLVPAISVHPYRPDALAELDKWAAKGARFVKWLPNAMGMDPGAERVRPFYERMKQHGMVLLTHAGEEKAVQAEEAQALGNPLKLRLPLDVGLKVVVAHCASLGTNADLDDPKQPQVANFDLFLRLMDQPKYRGLLFGEISAMVQANRLPRPIVTLIDRPDLHDRLVNGSDYPLPAINVVVRTSALQAHGLITGYEREALDEIYDYNPLLFDFVIKRTMRSPKTGRRLPARVFQQHPELPVFGR